MKREWVAAYYPSDLVEDQRLKTLFCLLYDKVVFHFPVTGMACGGGHGISGFYSDDPLVEEGVLDLREELLLDEWTLARVYTLRRMMSALGGVDGMELLLQRFVRTKTNREFLETLNKDSV